jgi:hypothetical protein
MLHRDRPMHIHLKFKVFSTVFNSERAVKEH